METRNIRSAKDSVTLSAEGLLTLLWSFSESLYSLSQRVAVLGYSRMQELKVKDVAELTCSQLSGWCPLPLEGEDNLEL